MSECPNDLQKEHIGALATLNTKVNHLENRIDDLSSMKDAVIELKVLQEKADKRNEKFDEIIEKYVQSNTDVAITLKGIDDNLKTLNNRVEKIEVKQGKSEERGKVDILDFLAKNWFYITLTLGGIIGVLKYIKVF